MRNFSPCTQTVLIPQNAKQHGEPAISGKQNSQVSNLCSHAAEFVQLLEYSTFRKHQGKGMQTTF